MGSSVCFAVTVLVSVCLHYAILMVTIAPQWRYTSPKNLDPVREYKGLWLDCSRRMGQRTRCFVQNKSIFDMPEGLAAERALMVIACVCSFIASWSGFFSLDFVRINGDVKSPKKGLKFAAGIMAFIAALGCGIAVSMEAWRVFRFQYMPNRKDVHWFGPMIYLGWLVSFCCILVSFAFIKAGCTAESEENDENHFSTNYQMGHGKGEYV